jgi:CRP-like cAMP-binding protein
MSEPDSAAVLETAPLFTGFQRGELAEVSRVMRPRPVAVGDVLWHQGADAEGMALVVEGRVAVELRLPGGRTVALAEAGPGETLGELPLMDGGPHSATARVTQAGSVLVFGRADFAPFVARAHPSAYALQRRLAELTAARLRRQLEQLAAALGPGGPGGPEAGPAAVLDQLDDAATPDPGYVRRMATFRAIDGRSLDDLLAAGRYASCPQGRTLDEEGAPAAAFCLVVNGAVERVLARGERRIRVGLAGPGQAFGYEGLLDGQPSPASAVARERTVLFLVPREGFTRLFAGDGRASLALLDVVNRDLASWLRRVIRPQAHLAVRPTTG